MCYSPSIVNIGLWKSLLLMGHNVKGVGGIIRLMLVGMIR